MKSSEWNWGKIDEIVASFARPYQQYTCSTSIAFALFYAVVNKADALVIGALAVPCAGLAAGSAVLRTIDKKTAAAAATEDKKTAAMGGPVEPLRSEQVA